MKTFLISILALLSFSVAHADIEGAPFIPEIDKRFDAIEQGNHLKTNSYPSGAADGHYVRQLAQASYNFSTVGGTAGTYNLGVTLPANAIIEKSWIDEVTQVYGASSKLGFECGTAQNIFNPVSLAANANGTILDGTQTGSAANMSTVSSKCSITARVQGTVSSGLATVYVEYVVHQ